MKHIHEVRDPIHAFVLFDTDERKVINSPPFQRLRDVHQLSMSYLVYPGASHKRFEHSLGVMELASRIFDVVTNPLNLTSEEVKEQVPELTTEDSLTYWRRVLRFAALCHDIGHLPFSHAAEAALLPGGWDHERLTHELILGEAMAPVWESLSVPVRREDVAALAVGRAEKGTTQALLSEMIVGDVFGADRMDYLLRDSHHIGVPYGRFDQYRLIDTLRILSAAPTGEPEESAEPILGIEEGGLQSAEALLLARYFMYSQVYFHHVRRIYDRHLQDFLGEWLDDGVFSTELSEHLEMSDSRVNAAILEAAEDDGARGHDPARRIVKREHFRRVYQRLPEDLEDSIEPGEAVAEALSIVFSPSDVRHDRYTQRGGLYEFPVLTREGRRASSVGLSTTLQHLPVVFADSVYVNPDIQEKAEKWIDENLKSTLKQRREVEEDEPATTSSDSH